ncbi:hypothetical protein DdX_12599 [Ditylenchus destructor]|uniref:Uncharacterized protein n=1 Tax=Ditylenchus destructor TaxID=166010 RepID=A0AAD4MV03_9BILA|nr:hypothetical protein DdX_12599 [Ditylenchus destructor]
MDNTLDTVMQQVNSTNLSDQTGNNANGEQSNGSNVDNISEESRANNDNTETPIGAKKPMQNKSKQTSSLANEPPAMMLPRDGRMRQLTEDQAPHASHKSSAA